MQKKDIFMLYMGFKGINNRLTIIVPVNNEQENIPRLCKALTNFIKISLLPTKVLFVNDGSTDSSLDLITNICREYTHLNYITLKTKSGLSAALKAGIDHADTELIGYIDADLQTSPMDFNLLLEYIGSYDLVIGIRNQRQDRWTKRTTSILANRIRRLFTKDGIVDTGCPLKLMRSDFAKRIPMFKGLHRFIPAMILLQNGRIKQVPVRHFPRLGGKSHFTTCNRLVNTLIDCFVFLWIKKRYINYEIDN